MEPVAAVKVAVVVKVVVAAVVKVVAVVVVKVVEVVEEAPAWDLVEGVYVPVVELQFRINSEHPVCMRSAPSVGRL